MQIEIPILISFLSLLTAIIVGITGIKRNQTADERKAASEMTTMIVKLENINDGVNEIKSDMRNMRADIQEVRDRLIIVEQSTKAAHKRIDDILKPET